MAILSVNRKKGRYLKTYIAVRILKKNINIEDNKVINMNLTKLIISFLLAILIIIPISSLYAQDNICSIDTGECIVPDISEIRNAPDEIKYHEDPTKVCVVYFYSQFCQHCENIKPFIDGIENKYSEDIILTHYDVTLPENIALYNRLCQSKNYEDKKIPLIGINNKMLVGEPDIRNNLESEIQIGIANDDKICPLEGMECISDTDYENNDPLIPQIGDKLEWMKILPLILFTGLADGINPCAFAVLLFIMAFLIEISSSKKRLIKITIAYISALFTVNILLGIIYFYTSIKFGNPELIRNIAIVLALIAGGINIKDYFHYGEGITLKIPESSKKYIQKLTKKATVPSAIILGSLVALLEAPCSIPIYLTVLEVLKGHGQNILQIMPYIVTYNLMFILPLILISGAIYYGGEAKVIEKWRNSHKKSMKLMIGIILIILALAMFLGYI